MLIKVEKYICDNFESFNIIVKLNVVNMYLMNLLQYKYPYYDYIEITNQRIRYHSYKLTNPKHNSVESPKIKINIHNKQMSPEFQEFIKLKTI